jgi:hypothetical protein
MKSAKGNLTATACHPTKKVNKPEELTYLFKKTLAHWTNFSEKVKTWSKKHINKTCQLKPGKGAGICGLYYKTLTIIIKTIVSDATVWSVTYDHN